MVDSRCHTFTAVSYRKESVKFTFSQMTVSLSAVYMNLSRK